MHNNNKSVISSTTLSFRLFLSGSAARLDCHLKLRNDGERDRVHWILKIYVQNELNMTPVGPSSSSSSSQSWAVVVSHIVILHAAPASSTCNSYCAVSNGACTSFLNIFREAACCLCVNVCLSLDTAALYAEYFDWLVCFTSVFSVCSSHFSRTFIMIVYITMSWNRILFGCNTASICSNGQSNRYIYENVLLFWFVGGGATARW